MRARFNISAAVTLALLAAAVAQTPGIVTEPIQRDERLWCMGLDAYKAGFDPACFAAPAGCERPNHNAPSNVQEAEMRAYLACSAARPAR